jgi:fatty-acyl-CoA synthase
VKPGCAITEAEIHAHCGANLARFKCPARIEFVQALPRNATGKIHKPTLRQQFGSPGEVDQVIAVA